MNYYHKNDKVALFLNGESPLIFPEKKKYKKIFATDGAFQYLKKKNIIPDVITGDFDSIKKNNLPKDVEIIHTPDQNFTDFEKVLQIIDKKKIKNVDIWGSSGKEQDHFLSNLSIGLKYSKKLSIRFYDNYSYYFFSKKFTILNKVKGKIISLFPFPKTKKVNTKGLKYLLKNKNLNIKKKIGIRNKAIKDQIEISYKSGSLLLFVEK